MTGLCNQKEIVFLSYIEDLDREEDDEEGKDDDYDNLIRENDFTGNHLIIEVYVLENQQRIFYTEHSDRNKIERLYNSYTYNSDWKNYLPYAKEKESFWKRLKAL